MSTDSGTETGPAQRVIELWDTITWGSPAIVAPTTIVRKLGSPGWMISRHADVPYYPACMIKVPLAIAAHTLVADGVLSVEDVVEIGTEQVTESPGPAEYKPGSKARIDELLFHALTYSDNTAANMLLDVVGRSRATDIVARLGLHSTFLRRYVSGTTILPDPRATGRNEHSAVDAVEAIALIMTDRVPNAHGLRMLLWRSTGPYNDELGNPFGATIYEKDGVTSAVYHDVLALEFPAATYVACVYTPLGTGDASKRAIFDYWVRLARILAPDAKP